MVFAKTKQAAAKLSAQVKDHSFGKKYYAKVRLPEGKTFEQATGHEKTGTLQDWIQFEPKENKSCVIEQKQRENEREDIRHPADGKRSQLQKPRHTATSQNKIQEAVLDYQVIRQGEGSALLDITLHTGRHHQIRVQFAHLGTPICGDHKYGKAERGTLVSRAIVSTGKVSTVFVRSRLNHVMKRFCSHDSDSQCGFVPSGNTNSPNRLSK